MKGGGSKNTVEGSFSWDVPPWGRSAMALYISRASLYDIYMIMYQ